MWIAIISLFAVLVLGSCQDEGDTSPPAADAAQPAPAEQSSASSAQQEPTALPAVKPQDPMVLPTAIPAPDNLQIPQGVPEELATVWEVWSLLTEQHVDRREFETDTFNEAAIRGLIQGLGDPPFGLRASGGVRYRERGPVWVV